MNQLLKLLAAIANLTRAGGLKNIEQVYGIAKRELGDKFNAAKKQIDMAFKEGQKQKKLDDRTKDIKKIDESVVSEGIETLADAKSGKSIMDQIQESKTKIEDASSKISKAQKEIDEMYKPKTDEEIEKKFSEESDLMKRLEEKVKNMANVENISMGLTRTIAREILSKKGIEIPKGTDAIQIFKQKFGQDVLIDVNDLAEELVEMDRRGIKPKPLTQLIEDGGFFDVKMPKEPPQGFTPDELADIQKEIEQEDMLLKFDPTGRKSNSMGGINRLNFATGGIKAIMAIIQSIKKLDPIEAMKEVNKVIARKGKYKNITDKESQKIFDDTQDHIFEREPKPTEFDIDFEEIESTRKLAPKMTERLEIKAKYPGIDDELVDKILIDDNPQRKAELLATLDETFKMMDKGMEPDEIIDIFKNQNRTKQAMGTGPKGLSEITGLYEKIRSNNIEKQKDANDNKQMRFRKLLASNKFPELNTFLEAELNEDDEKIELDVRTNLAVGGSPFTAQQLAQEKQQSYLDYLARQGVGQSGTATGPAPTFNPFTGTSTTPPASGGSQPGTGGGGGTTNTGTGNTGGGSTGGGSTGGGSTGGGSTGGGSSGGGYSGGSTGGGSTGSSGGGTSGGGSNLYTGANNRPPSMGSNTGGFTGGSTGGSIGGYTGGSNVGGGGFGGSGSIVGGGTGSTGTNNQVDTGDLGSEAANVAANNAATGSTGSTGGETGAAAIAAYKNYLKNHTGGSPVSFNSFRRITPKFKGQLTFTTDSYDELQNVKNAVSGGWQDDGTYDRTMINNLFPDTGDLGSEAANDAANAAATGTDQSATADDGFEDQSYTADDAARAKALAEAELSIKAGKPVFLEDDYLTDINSPWNQSKDMGADANDGFEDQSYTDDQGNKRITQDLYDQAKYDFFKEQGKIPENASLEAFKSGKFAGATYSPRDTNLNLSFKDHLTEKYGTSEAISSNPKYAYTQVGGGADFSQISSLPETSNAARTIQTETNDQNILQKANEFATKHGKTITAASYLLDAVAPGTGKIIRTAQTLNKGYNMYTDSKDAAINETLNNPQTTQPRNDDLFNQGSASLQFNKGGRVNKAVGGLLDPAARQKQSQLDFLARQGKSATQPQPPTGGLTGPGVTQPPTGGLTGPGVTKPAVNPQTPGTQPSGMTSGAATTMGSSMGGLTGPGVTQPPPGLTSSGGSQQPQAIGGPTGPGITPPFDMSKYKGGYFDGGIEDSRNIALNNLASLGVDVSKYKNTTPTNTSGPKFKGLSMNEIMSMDLNTAKEKLGFDPSVPNANPEFEKFMMDNDPGPQMIGPGGFPGMKSSFQNEDELAQILNRAIPYYMQTARDLGENYTLEEMLAMSDDDLAMLDDRYDKKMEIGQYAKRPGGQYNQNPGNLTPQKTIEVQMKERIGTPGTGAGNSLTQGGYMNGGRVKLKYGGDAYGQSTKVKKAMQADYNDPFKKLMGNDSSRFIKSTSGLTRYAKNLNKLKNSKQAKAALRKSLLVQNEKTRKDALKRLSLLKKLYSGGKSV